MSPADQAARLRQIARGQTNASNGDGGSPADGSPTATADAPSSETAVLQSRATATRRQQPSSDRSGMRSTSSGADRHPLLIRPRHALARVIAVASGKGGVGKSNIAVNLAINLASLGRAVTLIDADMGMANADVLCGLTPSHNLAHFLTGRRKSLEGLAIDAPGNVKLIPGASGLHELARLKEAHLAPIVRELSQLERSNDFLIVDTSAGIGPSVTTLAGAADLILTVITPEPTSLADGYGLIKAIHRYERKSRRENELRSSPLRFAVIANMVESEDQGRAVYERISAVAYRFLRLQVGYAGTMPIDPCVTQAVVRRHPFACAAPRCPASRSLRRIARSLIEEVNQSKHTTAQELPDQERPTAGGYFARLVHRLRGGT